MSDYTIGIAERIASLPDSTATANSVNRNYFQETSQSVVNTVNVAIVPAAPTALDPTPQTTYATATDEDSVETFGVQETPIVITLLATIEDAGALAQYLIRSVPAYWFSNLAVSLNTLSEANKNIVANLEIGQQIAVTKTFPAGVVPQTVTEYLFVEGISHNVTVDNHIVTIYTGPASTFLQWVLGNYSVIQTRTNLLKNPSFEINTTGWNPNGSTNTRVAATWGTGSYAYQIVHSGTGLGGTFTDFGSFNVTPGVQYTASFYAKSIFGILRNVQIGCNWFNAGGTQILQTAANKTLTTNSQQWTLTSTAPANATTALMYAYANTTGLAGDTWQLDSAMFEQSSSVLPYFDGTYLYPYTGYTLTFQAWDGVANASTSTTVWGLNSSGTGSALGDSTYGLA
jgi:hypothetical protein